MRDSNADMKAIMPDMERKVGFYHLPYENKCLTNLHVTFTRFPNRGIANLAGPPLQIPLTCLLFGNKIQDSTMRKDKVLNEA